MVYILGLLALAGLAAAIPTETTPNKRDGVIAARAPCTTKVTLAPGSNPFSGRKFYANDYYAGEIAAAIEVISDESTKTKAAAVAKIGTFLWIDTIARVPLVAETLAKVPCGEIAEIVIYDLPGRDCAAKASNGELPVGSIARYKSEYIDPIVAAIKANPNVAVALVIEPDSLPNLVTNANLTTCQASKQGYEEGVAYALKSLNLPNVAMYIDVGHGGWLGWDANLKPGAEGITKVWKAAGSPKQVFGFATNVAGWNQFQASPGEFSDRSDAKYNKCQDEKRYVAAFAPLIKAGGMAANAIVDTGRNAVPGLRLEWGDWCNVKGAGFGPRPTSSTGDSNVHAFVWVKPGGESDGTSDTTADRYDSFCGHADAFQPSPEAGQWHQTYFEELIANAKPSF